MDIIKLKKEELIKMNTFKSKSKLLATITIMLLFASSMLAVVPQAKALGTFNLSDAENPSVILNSADVTVGQLINAAGIAEASGAVIRLYWGPISNGIILAEKELSTSSLNFDFNFTVPEYPAGDYTIFATEGLATGGSSSAASLSQDVTIIPSITIDPTSGVVGDTVMISGKGFNATSTDNANRITVTFGGTTVIATGANIRTDSKGSFGPTAFTVPSKADGPYTVTATDGSGNSADATFIIGPVIELSRYDGPSGLVVTVTGRGFTNITDTEVDITFDGIDIIKIPNPVKITASTKNGTFTAQIIIPSMNATNINQLKDIVATDTLGATTSKEFNLTGVTTITATPTIAKIGVTEVTVTGGNFSQWIQTPANSVTMRLRPVTNPTASDFSWTTTGVATTGTLNSITAKIPYNIPSGVYWLNVTDLDGLTAETLIGVSNTNVFSSDASVVTGQVITVGGTGFDIINDYATAAGIAAPLFSISIGGVVVARGLTAAQLTGQVVVVPTIPVNPQTVVSITCTTPGISFSDSTTIGVTQTTTLKVIPSSTARDNSVTVEGSYFTQRTGGQATVRIYNSTNQIAANLVGTYTTPINPDGSFSIQHYVGPNDNLGTYTANATDNNYIVNTSPQVSAPLFAIKTFSVLELDISITTGALKYAQGDKGSFQILSATTPDGTITIRDVNGTLYKTIYLTQTGWEFDTTKGVYVYPVIGYGSGSGLIVGTTFDITDDAYLGNWTWTANIIDANKVIPFEGKFEVVPKSVGAGGGGNGGLGETEVRNIVKDEVKGITKGDKGDKGDTGSSGSSGSSGATGATGSAGKDGATGATGSAGKDGIDGKDNSSGWATSAAIIAIVALIVGAIAAFLAITLRRKIAN
jgi:hypothetical protein